MDSLRYPDDGGLLEDASILKNVVAFTTAQRAFTAHGILWQVDQTSDSGTLAFLAINAFTADMTSTEDVLGWLFVLNEWQPGTVEGCLLRLLDKVEVGRRAYSEERAAELLQALDPVGLRSLLHIPNDSEMAREGYPQNVRERINAAVPANLDGLKRLVELRQRDGRRYVRAYNKLKHLLLAIPTEAGEPPRKVVLVPKWRSYNRETNAVHIQDTWIFCQPDSIRRRASRAIAAQAVLNSLLGLVLWTRFGVPYSTPEWAVRALDLPGWIDGDA